MNFDVPLFAIRISEHEVIALLAHSSTNAKQWEALLKAWEVLSSVSTPDCSEDPHTHILRLSVVLSTILVMHLSLLHDEPGLH